MMMINCRRFGDWQQIMDVALRSQNTKDSRTHAVKSGSSGVWGGGVRQYDLLLIEPVQLCLQLWSGQTTRCHPSCQCTAELFNALSAALEALPFVLASGIQDTCGHVFPRHCLVRSASFLAHDIVPAQFQNRIVFS